MGHSTRCWPDLSKCLLGHPERKVEPVHYPIQPSVPEKSDIRGVVLEQQRPNKIRTGDPVPVY